MQRRRRTELPMRHSEMQGRFYGRISLEKGNQKDDDLPQGCSIFRQLSHREIAALFRLSEDIVRSMYRRTKYTEQ